VDHSATSRNKPLTVDRRRFPRQRPTSIIYVELDSSNGGFIRDLSVGGLAFQAAGKLPEEEDITLKFRLQKQGQSIEVLGGVAWVAQTQKEAGIYFKSISSEAREEIIQWIARLDTTYQAAASASPLTAARRVGNVATMPSLKDQRAGADPEVASTNNVASIRPGVDEHPRPVIFKPAETPVPPKEPSNPVQIRQAEAAGKVPKREWVLATFISPLLKPPAVEGPISPEEIAFRAQELVRRRKVLLVGSAALSAFLAVILIVAYISGPGSKSSHTADSSSRTATQSRPASSWTTLINGLFGNSRDDARKYLSQDQVGVPVWVSKHTGYYYCSGSPDYGSSRPGGLMLQGEALQSGYQPKLGDFCY
jgi:hypothetical protein